jgi:hypothetical protein
MEYACKKRRILELAINLSICLEHPKENDLFKAKRPETVNEISRRLAEV